MQPKEPGDITAPSTIGDLTATAMSASEVDLSWTAPGDDGTSGRVQSYQIRRSLIPINSSNFSSSQIVPPPATPDSAGSSETITISGLSPATLYYFAIIAFDEAGNTSEVSNSDSATTFVSADLVAPRQVSDLAVTGSATTEIALVWTAPGDDGAMGTATTYDLRYSTSAINAGNFGLSSIVSNLFAPDTAGTIETCTVAGLEANTRYYFALKTSDEANNTSLLSNVPTAMTLSASDTSPPATISDLAVTLVTPTAIRIRWTAPGEDLGGSSPCTSYDIRFSTTPINSSNFSIATPFSVLPLPSAPGSSDSTIQVGLSPNTTYYFAVEALDEVLNASALSNVVSATTLPPPDTVRPAAVTDLSVAQVGPLTARLTLTATGDDSLTGGATAYELRRSLSPIDAGNFASALLVLGTPPPGSPGAMDTLAVPGLTAGTTYYFAVKVVDDNGNRSAISNVATATTPIPPDGIAPSSITTLAITGQASTSSTLSWTAPGDDANSGTAAAYDLRYSTIPISPPNFGSATPVSGLPAPSVAGTSESFTVTGLSPSTTYYFAIRTADEASNWSSLSNVVSGATTP